MPTQNYWDQGYNGLQGSPWYVPPAGAPGAPGVGVQPGVAPKPYDPTNPYGKVPNIPSLVASQTGAVQGNLANLPGITKLAGDTNKFNLGQVTDQYTAGIPNYTALTNQSSINTGAALRGDMTQSEKDMIAQDAAQRGVAQGTVGSDFSNYDFVRSMHENRAALRRQGEQDLSGAVARMPRTPIFDPSKLYITPDEVQAASTAQSNLNAAPDPRAANELAMKKILDGLKLGAGGITRPPPPGGPGNGLMTPPGGPPGPTTPPGYDGGLFMGAGTRPPDGSSVTNKGSYLTNPPDYSDPYATPGSGMYDSNVDPNVNQYVGNNSNQYPTPVGPTQGGGNLADMNYQQILEQILAITGGA